MVIVSNRVFLHREGSYNVGIYWNNGMFTCNDSASGMYCLVDRRSVYVCVCVSRIEGGGDGRCCDGGR